MKFYWESYGCSANQADMERILGLLALAGFEPISDVKDSDFIILNSFEEKVTTENRMISRFRDLSRYGKPVIVTGCLPKMNLGRCLNECKGFAALLDPNSIDKIVDVVHRVLSGESGIIEFSSPKRELFSLPKLPTHKIIHIVPISFGCLGNCAFCGVKNVRERLVSVPIIEIRSDIERALRDGKKEFWLTSQDDGVYGWDIGTNLNVLLKSILEIDGVFRLRVGMMNPGGAKTLLPDIVSIFRDERLYKFIHVPVQSGSDRILRLMKRQHTVQDFVEVVEAFRSKYPNITISTDIIVGFPGETDEDFQMTYDLIDRVRPDIVNVSKFGAHPSTLAVKMEKISNKVIKRRSKILSEIVKKVSLKRNKKWIGWEGEALIDEIGKNNTLVARNFAYKPIVLKADKKLFGKFVKVKIKNARKTYLIGEIVN